MTSEQIRFNERVKAMRAKMENLKPYIKDKNQTALILKLANSEITEDDIKKIPDSVIDWPQQVGKSFERKDKEDNIVKPAIIPTDLQIRGAIKDYQAYMNIIGFELDLRLEHVIAAEIKECVKFSMKGVKYVGLTFENGLKCSVILDSKKEVIATVKGNSKKPYARQFN